MPGSPIVVTEGVTETLCTRRLQSRSQHLERQAMMRGITKFGQSAVQLRSQSHEGKRTLREDR